jgi:squalene-hopene/tetraprenyl-beta-curcumene cyclase
MKMAICSAALAACFVQFGLTAVGRAAEPLTLDNVRPMLSLQKPDGGWGLATLGNWQRGDELPQNTKTSDGYGTSFVLYALRRSGMPPSDEPLRRGVQWLKTHQRESGTWFTRSLYQDSMHHITHAGTAMAVMALAACDELQASMP